MEQTIENRGSQDSSAEADRLRQEVFVKPEEGKMPETADKTLATPTDTTIKWKPEWTSTLDAITSDPSITWNFPTYENWKLEKAKPTAAQLAREQLEPKYDSRFDIADPYKETRDRFDEMRTLRLPFGEGRSKVQLKHKCGQLSSTLCLELSIPTN